MYLYLLTRDYQGKRVNPPYRSSTKVIPLNLFLDIVPSSSADITRAMSGQPRRLWLEATGDEMAGTLLYMV